MNNHYLPQNDVTCKIKDIKQAKAIMRLCYNIGLLAFSEHNKQIKNWSVWVIKLRRGAPKFDNPYTEVYNLFIVRKEC